MIDILLFHAVIYAGLQQSTRKKKVVATNRGVYIYDLETGMLMGYYHLEDGEVLYHDGRHRPIFRARDEARFREGTAEAASWWDLDENRSQDLQAPSIG